MLHVDEEAAVDVPGDGAEQDHDEEEGAHEGALVELVREVLCGGLDKYVAIIVKDTNNKKCQKILTSVLLGMLI